MKHFKKLMVITISVLAVYCFFAVNLSFADSSDSEYSVLNTRENNIFLISYLQKFNNSSDKSYVYTNGLDIEYSKKLKINNMIKNKKYSELKDYLTKNKISIGYSEVNMKPISNDRSIPSESGSYVKRFYESADGKIGGNSTYVRKEWTTVLTGNFTLDNKGRIISTNGARISVETNFGAAFAPYMENAHATASYRKPNTLICSGGYHMKSTVLLPIAGFGINSIMDFGLVYRGFEINV